MLTEPFAEDRLYGLEAPVPADQCVLREKVVETMNGTGQVGEPTAAVGKTERVGSLLALGELELLLLLLLELRL